ncbi:MAG: hypothetical protein Q9185_002561 [Variospora sp. 1 TL-2023]
MAAHQDDVNFDEWEIGMPLIGDEGDDAGYRIKNLNDETERVNMTGNDRNTRDPAVLGRLYHIVNGYMRGGCGKPATLIVFEWMLRTGSAQRFRQTDIDIVFESRGLRDGMFPGDELSFYDPAVVKVGPTVPIESDPVEYTVDQTTGLKLGANVGFNGASIDPEMSRNNTESGIRRVDYRLQEGYPLYVKRDSGPMDGAHWTLRENVKAQSGLPRLVRTAVLLERRPGDDEGRFAATISTKVRVSVWENAVEKFRRAVGRVPNDDPVHINPAPRKGIAHGATVLFGSRDVAEIESPFDKDNLNAVDLDDIIVIRKESAR